MRFSSIDAALVAFEAGELDPNNWLGSVEPDRRRNLIAQLMARLLCESQIQSYSLLHKNPPLVEAGQGVPSVGPNETDGTLLAAAR
jgi:hypothetical protein